MRKLVRLVAMVFSMLFLLQLQGCSDLPTKENNEPANKVIDDTKNASSVEKVEAEPDCE